MPNPRSSESAAPAVSAPEESAAVWNVLPPSLTSEQERVHRLLHEQRERFAFATDAAEIGYWFCDLPFDKLIWDARVKDHFWLPPEADVTIDLFYALLHEDDRQRTQNAILTSIEQHTTYDIEYRTVSPDGRIKWIRAIGRTAYDDAGAPLRFDGITQDITRLKLAQEALDSERQRLTALFENAPIGMLFSDASGRVLSGNAHLQAILRHPIVFSPGVDSYGEWVSYHPDGRRVQPEEYPLALALRDGVIHAGEFLYHCGDGVQRWVEFTAAPIRDALGVTVGGVVLTVDIDARKRTQEALVRSEKLALVGRLASTISHEINNPLESVTNLLYLIEQTTPDPTSREYSRTALNELARVSHIVTHTLRFSRQANRPSLESVSALLDSALAIYEPRLRSSGAAVYLRYRGPDTVCCLASELRQVFANLVGNAFDAIKSGGRLVVRTCVVGSGASTRVRVTIADTGSGISPAAQRNLFEPFFTTKGENGTGLGLWVSREILDKHHAVIRVRSRQAPGPSGTVFILWLDPHLDAARLTAALPPASQ